MSTIFETVARIGVLGFCALVFVLLFAFVIVASLVDVDGIRSVDAETQKTFFTVLTTIVASLGGAAAVLFKGRE